MNTAWKEGMLVNERYKIAGIAGQGGMGTVYMAEDMRLPGKKVGAQAHDKAAGSNRPSAGGEATDEAVSSMLARGSRLFRLG